WDPGDRSPPADRAVLVAEVVAGVDEPVLDKPLYLVVAGRGWVRPVGIQRVGERVTVARRGLRFGVSVRGAEPGREGPEEPAIGDALRRVAPEEAAVELALRRTHDGIDADRAPRIEGRRLGAEGDPTARNH